MGKDARGFMLLSIHPTHAADILSGHKTVELRRVRPSITPGQLVLLYASSPVCAVVGACRVDALETGALATIKRKYLRSAAIPGRAFETYYLGAAAATALLLDCATALPNPVPLSTLRESPATTPTQSWRFVSKESFVPLLGEADRRTLDVLAERGGNDPGEHDEDSHKGTARTGSRRA